MLYMLHATSFAAVLVVTSFAAVLVVVGRCCLVQVDDAIAWNDLAPDVPMSIASSPDTYDRATQGEKSI